MLYGMFVFKVKGKLFVWLCEDGDMFVVKGVGFDECVWLIELVFDVYYVIDYYVGWLIVLVCLLVVYLDVVKNLFL